MEIIAIALILVATGGYLYEKKRRKQKNENIEQVAPVVAHSFETIRWFRLDDTPRMMVNASGDGVQGDVVGDANGAQELPFDLGLSLHYGKLPMAMGVTATREGRDRDLTQLAVDAFGLDIPVLYGSPHASMAPSTLATEIVKESKKGLLWITVGGTVTDIAQAIKQGANVANIIICGTIYGTSNEEGDQAAADIVKKSGVRVFNIGSPEYQKLILDMPKTPAVNEVAFIEKWRKLKAWDLCFTISVMAKSKMENAFQFKHSLPLRISDCMNVDRMLSGDPANYKGYLDYAGIVARAENGLNKALALAPIIRPKKARPNRTEFNVNDVNTLGYTNPLSFPVTSAITKADLRIGAATVEHTKQGAWKSMSFSGGTVNANLWLIYHDGVRWCAFPYEYLRPNDGRKDKGWSVIDADVFLGDKIGVMTSTIVRRGELVNGKERSNIHWVAAS